MTDRTRPLTILFACLALISSCATLRGQDAQDAKPRGIYALSSVSAPVQGAIRDYSFVEGLVQRITWATLEPSPGVYDFSLIDSAIAQLETIDQKLTLALFNSGATGIPSHILTAPGTQTFTHPQFGLSVVPWDANALQQWDALCSALAAHLVPNAAAGGTMVPLSRHPILAQISAPVLGLNSFRLTGQSAVTLPGYSRPIFTQAFLASIHSIRDRFSSKFSYVGFFGMNDGMSNPTLNEVIETTLMTEFDGIQHPRLGLFQENLSYSIDAATGVGTGRPNPSGLGSALADTAAQGGYVLLQALQGWNCPFANPANTANATAIDGMHWALATYDCSYFELYSCDLDDVALWPALDAMAAILRDAPHQENSAAATLLLDERAYFRRVGQGAASTLTVSGAPNGYFEVHAGANLEPMGLATPLGLVDLDIAQPTILVSAAALPAVGTLDIPVVMPSVGPLVGLGLQGFIFDGASWAITGRVSLEIL